MDRCFIAQCPLALGGLALVLWKLPKHNITEAAEAFENPNTTERSNLARVDFLGAFALVGMILSGLLSLDLAAKDVSWYVRVVLVTSFGGFLTLFIFIEKRVAKEPIMPLGLLVKRDVVTSYLVVAFQAGGQFGVSCEAY